jgi:CHASE1-domain containing sensor protein
MKNDPAFSNPAFKPTVMGLMVLFVGATLSVVYWQSATHVDRARVRLVLENDVEDIAALIHGSVKGAMSRLESIESLYRSSEHVTRKAFDAFVEQFFTPDSGIQALEWIPRVSHAQRQQYVQAARDEGLTDL